MWERLHRLPSPAMAVAFVAQSAAAAPRAGAASEAVGATPRLDADQHVGAPRRVSAN